MTTNDQTQAAADAATLTTQTYWESAWEGKGARRGFELFDEVARHLPPTPGLSFLEVGCAPGGILAEFCARLGYEAHGVDFAADPREVEEFLRAEGVRVGEVHRADFLTWEPGRLYDVVASFGFIEHFENASEVVDRHFRLAREGGHVCITMPNFARGQKLLHWLYDRENLRLHNTSIMNLAFLRAAARRNGAELLAARYAGGQYAFWVEDDRKLSALSKRLMWRTDSALKRLTGALPAAGVNSWLSPFLVAVYRKNAAAR
jgi:2-polyprenyl-3-methyl-5-hydroxy-6-metoxy-1,4-benzoquinol methylase